MSYECFETDNPNKVEFTLDPVFAEKIRNSSLFKANKNATLSQAVKFYTECGYGYISSVLEMAKILNGDP